mgnify:FL=1
MGEHAVRLLAIGCALPNPEVDNYTVFSAPSYCDYDAVLVDPESITAAARRLVEENAEFMAHDGRIVVNGATTASAVSAAEQARRRFAETERLLANGGTVIVLGRPNAVQPGIVGFEGLDRYSWLPAPPGAAWGPPLLRPGEGQTVRIADEAHPLAGLLREYRNEFVWRAWFDERQAAFREHGRVIARGGSDVPIACEFRVLAGRVAFIPALKESSGPQRMKLAQSVVDAVRVYAGHAPELQPPYWARSLALPGLEQIEAELEAAETALRRASAALEAIRDRHRDLVALRQLVWGDARLFADAVRRALEVLGFAVTSPPGEPLEIHDDEGTALVETESAAQEVVEWPYIRLQRRLEQRLLERGERLKGIVAVNGFRSDAPEQRKQQFTDPLRIACENYRYTLLTGTTLFAMVQRALGGAGEAELAAMRRRLFRWAGVLPPDAALGASAGEESAGPLF